MDRGRARTRRARTCAPARDSRGSTRSRTPGSARPRPPSSRRGSTLATTDAAATESTVWSALTIVRTVRGIAEVVVLAVEHDAIGLEPLRRQLLERAAGRAPQRFGHAELVALGVARVADADAPRPTAHAPRGDLALRRRQQLRVTDAARDARRRARPPRPSPDPPTSRGRPRRCRPRPDRRRSSISVRCAASGTARPRATEVTRRSALPSRAHRSYDAVRAPRHACRGPVPLRSRMVAWLRGRRTRRQKTRPRATRCAAAPTDRSCRCSSTRTTCARNAAAARGGSVARDSFFGESAR